MPAPRTPRLKKQTTWFAREWMVALGKIQADLTKELEWPKAKANRVWNGQQRYNEDLVNQIAEWLHLRPFELLLPPAEAMDIRQMREAAVRIAAVSTPPAAAPAEAPAPAAVRR